MAPKESPCPFRDARVRIPAPAFYMKFGGNMKRFKFLTHTADAYYVAYGHTLEEAFENAALAMYEIITDTNKISPSVELKIRVEGFDLYSLLYNWLEELLFYTDSERLVFSKFSIEKISRENDRYVLSAKVRGEVFDPKKHECRNQVKAVTYSQMEISRKSNIYEVRVVLDL